MNKISVIMACYNGEKTIIRQLDSLRKQTRQPDEVLIFDDTSIDKTSEIVEEYIKNNSIQSWKLIRNKINIGWKQNFFNGAMQCSNDIVFFCDQDDEWKPDKIEKMVEILDAHQEINLLACDFEIKYGNHSIHMKKYKKKKTERTGLISQYTFTTRFFQNPSPGCTYAVRRKFIKEIRQYWFPDAPHDEFLWLFAVMTDSAWFYNENLITIYRGESNASDVKYKDITMQLKNIDYIYKILERLEEYTEYVADRCIKKESNSHFSKNKANTIEAAKIWCKKRNNLLKKRNPFLWLSMVAYWRYYNSFKNCLSDLYLVVFGSFQRRVK